MNNYTYLALGDSYTIGEQVMPAENFPYQTIALLSEKLTGNHAFSNPEIIAQTGWSTDELATAVDGAKITKQYDFVTLLIGVNNQYRGRTVDEYRIQFAALLQKAIGFAAAGRSHVFVLSIPDWGVTPFAQDRDSVQIAKEIDAYNDAAKDICERNKVMFIDITAAQRADRNKREFLAADQLHPSGREYAKWAKLLSSAILNVIAEMNEATSIG